jgi:hypothetical protein
VIASLEHPGGRPLLAPDTRRLLVWLGAFEGGVALEAVERLAALMEPRLDALADLVDHSLVVHHVAGAAPRYVLLGMIREVAAERLAARRGPRPRRHRGRRAVLSLGPCA